MDYILISKDQSEALAHRSHKYVRRERKNGRWVYYYYIPKGGVTMTPDQSRRLADANNRVNRTTGFLRVSRKNYIRDPSSENKKYYTEDLHNYNAAKEEQRKVNQEIADYNKGSYDKIEITNEIIRKALKIKIKNLFSKKKKNQKKSQSTIYTPHAHTSSSQSRPAGIPRGREKYISGKGKPIYVTKR